MNVTSRRFRELAIRPVLNNQSRRYRTNRRCLFLKANTCFLFKMFVNQYINKLNALIHLSEVISDQRWMYHYDKYPRVMKMKAARKLHVFLASFYFYETVCRILSRLTCYYWSAVENWKKNCLRIFSINFKIKNEVGLLSWMADLRTKWVVLVFDGTKREKAVLKSKRDQILMAQEYALSSVEIDCFWQAYK